MIGGLHIQQVRQVGVEVRQIPCHPATATTTAMIPRMATRGVARAPSPLPPPPPRSAPAVAQQPPPPPLEAGAAAAAAPGRSPAAAPTTTAAAAMAYNDPVDVGAAAAYAAAVDACLEKAAPDMNNFLTWHPGTFLVLGPGQGHLSFYGQVL